MAYKTILVYLTHPHVEAWNFKVEHKSLLQTRIPDTAVQICANSREFKDKLSEADAVVVWYFREEWLTEAPRLKLIATPAAGNEWIPWKAPENLRILFGGFHGPMIAESVIGAIFHFIKAFPLSMVMQEKKKWARIKITEQVQSLYEARVTIFGFGKIGTTIARLLKPFGCNITGIRRSELTVPDYFEAKDKLVALDQLEIVLKETDHLICALPGGPETDKILKAFHFKSLPKTSFLYNVGRGNIYKEADLVEALQTGEIAGAYLDVFEEEPLAEMSPLWGIKNVLLQPHISAVSPQYLELFVEELAGKIESGKLN
ncbi:MAG: D-2-hydroxyacid dehydrogenase [Nitrospinota bacterium]|nr:D-2-hydroxyacid dehydrogenase [Nitrospinota bacterium]